MRGRCFSRQRGVAVVTALLLTTLAITIVASLFWQQQVQVRSIENQRLQLQKQWILRGALDWAQLILREDGKRSTIDHMGEPWAVPLAETRLDDYVEKSNAEGEASDAVLSGGIIDAQSRFNLTNLCQGGAIDDKEVAAFARLLTNARLDPSLAQATANLMAAAQARSSRQDGTAVQTADNNAESSKPMDIRYVDDLLAVPGFTPEAFAAIKDFVVVLPRKTVINVNTAPAEVLAARIDTLSLSEAATLVAARENAWFNTPGDFTGKLHNPGSATADIDVRTSFFLVNGDVRLNRAGMHMQTLIERNGSKTEIKWIREN